jgi:hypothetical protein
LIKEASSGSTSRCASPDRAGSGSPDFAIRSDGKPTKYVEVKPAEMLSDDRSADVAGQDNPVDAVLRRIEIAWLSEPDAELDASILGVRRRRLKYASVGKG